MSTATSLSVDTRIAQTKYGPADILFLYLMTYQLNTILGELPRHRITQATMVRVQKVKYRGVNSRGLCFKRY
jgi:hypothetical protein